MSVGRGVKDKKTTVDECWPLDMKDVAKRVNFAVASRGSITWEGSLGVKAAVNFEIHPPDRMRLYYEETHWWTGEKTNYDYTVPVVHTPCFYGGVRYWFLCPACKQRSRILYSAPGCCVFACRICHNLTYRNQQEGPDHEGRVIKEFFDAAVNDHPGYSERTKRRKWRKYQQLFEPLAWMERRSKKLKRRKK